MRNLLLGYLTWLLSMGSLVGVIVLCHWLLAPPMTDRAASFTFVAGGGVLFIATFVLAFAILVIIGTYYR